MKKSLSLAMMISLLLLRSNAFAVVQDDDQQKCILAMNKGLLKVASTELKAIEKCVGVYAKDGSNNVVDCYSTATSVDDARTRTCEAETSKCSTAPDFGKTSCANVNNYAEYNPYQLSLELFGNPNTEVTICSQDKARCTCEGKTLKALSKLYSTSLKAFYSCKRSGLATFADATALATCVGADPGGHIGTAQSKLEATILKACTSVTDPFAIGECPGLNGAALSDCLEARVRCRVCQSVAGADGLIVNCEMVDDGSDNLSCPVDDPT